MGLANKKWGLKVSNNLKDSFLELNIPLNVFYSLQQKALKIQVNYGKKGKQVNRSKIMNLTNTTFDWLIDCYMVFIMKYNKIQSREICNWFLSFK